MTLCIETHRSGRCPAGLQRSLSGVMCLTLTGSSCRLPPAPQSKSAALTQLSRSTNLMQPGTVPLHNKTAASFWIYGANFATNGLYRLFTVFAVDIQAVAFLQYLLTGCGDRRLQRVCHRPGLSARHCEHSHLPSFCCFPTRQGKDLMVTHGLSFAEEAPSSGRHRHLICCSKVQSGS